jgi:hypothetical protein
MDFVANTMKDWLISEMVARYAENIFLYDHTPFSFRMPPASAVCRSLVLLLAVGVYPQ